MNKLQRLTLGLFLAFAFTSLEWLIEGKPGQLYINATAGVFLLLFLLANSTGEPS